ncbi:transglycosylase domain-containing protein [Metasolibacillus meyeri]|uniref:Transglycosylase domain-containing protein n=1 Tax=Metasolibacillus meyeri TaxID=1071052 RepID=A0AAW9NKS6_9BACL|nr:transglycosylase domain-containing protein [Metasolibacillus meyeri]MEC1178277.1 transglycosylase domain-containing protein [Metasolibacillus meyeri]
MTERKLTREDIKKQRQQKQKKKKSPFKLWLKRIVLTIVFIGVLGFLGGAGLFAYYVSSAPELDEELLKFPVSSEFYDVNGELFATIGQESRKYVKFEDIPDDMVAAILATEDVRFFDHFGMDLWRLGGSVIANFRDGFGSQGASTITQQVVKNSFLSNDKKLKRKAQEAWLAIQLERQYSKEEIFEMYFNKILMSGRIYGFGQASEYFYGKPLNELELDQMATLAGMPQSPNPYNPFKYPDRAEKRRNVVLGLMVQHKKITQAQADEAKKLKVADRVLPEDERKPATITNYPAFLDVVLSELESNGDKDALAEGVKVYTTLDPNAQKTVESIMNNDANFMTEKIQSGVAVIDTRTGEIRAIGGGRNYGIEVSFGYNYAYDLVTRAPGSTMKPLIDYAPAIEYLKWSTGETLVDEPMKYTGTNQTITNWDNKYAGTMTARQALYTSRNIPAVKTLQAVGTDKAKNFVSRLGIDVDYVVESDAIGGGRINISPIQMAGAYAAFGNNGVYTTPHSITKIVYRDGSTSNDYKPKEIIAMSDYTAYMVTDMLRDVVGNKPNASGTAANVPGLDIAGKTGTTNYSADEFSKYNFPSSAVPDSWFAGYTTNYSIAVWSGYEQRSDAITTWDERRLPQTLFKSIMSQLSSSIETPRFTQPSSVVSATVEVGTSPLKLASEFTPDNLRMTELFVKGTEPQEVSDTFEQIELDAPFNLQAIYNDLANVIDLTWEHQAPGASEEDFDPNAVPISFEVTMTIDGAAPTTISVSGANYATIPAIEIGHDYVFTVTAISDDIRSESASVSLSIEGLPEVPDEEDWDNIEPEEPTEPIEPEEPTEPDTGTEDNNNGQVTPPTEPEEEVGDTGEE